MKKIVFATAADASHGFKLAGVRELAGGGDLPSALAALAADSSTGVVAIDERLVIPEVQRAIDDVERRSPTLVVVVLPAPSITEAPVEDYALRLIRKAIGYQVRVNL